MPQPPVTTEDDEMTLKTSNTMQNAPIAANVTTQITTFSREELAMYHHQSLGNPRKETLMRALKENPTQFETFPGLTHELIRDHLPPSEATEKGHMIMTRKGLKSTRTMTKQLVKARRDVGNFLPAEEVCLAEEDEIYCYAILGDSNDNTIYSDLTWRFPVESYDGKNYIFIGYVYKLNAIFMLPMKSREDACMVEAFKQVYAKLESRGHKPKLHILDNECSASV